MLRVVRGLDEHDRVIVNGLMRARPGVKVTPLTEAQMQEMQKKQQQQKNGGQGQPKGEAPKQKDESFKSTPESGTKASEKTMAAPADKPKETGQSAPKAEPAIREKIFANMSKRAADMMRDDLEVKGPVRLSDVDAAQKEVLAIARKLSDAGQLSLSSGGDEYV
jgi:hypothetical protein